MGGKEKFGFALFLLLVLDQLAPGGQRIYSEKLSV